MTTNAPARRRITGAALGLLLLGSTAAWSASAQSGGTSMPEPTVIELAVAVGSERSSPIEPAANVDLNMDECELVDGLSGMGW